MNAYRLFSAEEAREIREAITGWVPVSSANGRVEKHNDESTDEALVSRIAERVMDSPIVKAHFIEQICQPKFNRYRSGGRYGQHSDAAIQFGVRSDLACTVFLSDDYEGGELAVGGAEVRLPAGEAIVYECWRPHEVRPVTMGERVAAILWMQSYIRSEEQREVLASLRRVIVDTERESHFSQLGAIHEKLVKMWWK